MSLSRVLPHFLMLYPCSFSRICKHPVAGSFRANVDYSSRISILLIFPFLALFLNRYGVKYIVYLLFFGLPGEP